MNKAKLIDNFNPFLDNARKLDAFIHNSWRIPLMTLAGYNQYSEEPNSPVLSITVYCELTEEINTWMNVLFKFHEDYFDEFEAAKADIINGRMSATKLILTKGILRL